MEPTFSPEAHSSGVSWAAVSAGAFVTAALSLALLALGTGIGFSAVVDACLRRSVGAHISHSTVLCAGGSSSAGTT